MIVDPFLHRAPGLAQSNDLAHQTSSRARHPGRHRRPAVLDQLDGRVDLPVRLEEALQLVRLGLDAIQNVAQRIHGLGQVVHEFGPAILNGPLGQRQQHILIGVRQTILRHIRQIAEALQQAAQALQRRPKVQVLRPLRRTVRQTPHPFQGVLQNAVHRVDDALPVAAALPGNAEPLRQCPCHITDLADNLQDRPHDLLPSLVFPDTQPGGADGLDQLADLAHGVLKALHHRLPMGFPRLSEGLPNICQHLAHLQRPLGHANLHPTQAAQPAGAFPAAPAAGTLVPAAVGTVLPVTELVDLVKAHQISLCLGQRLGGFRRRFGALARLAQGAGRPVQRPHRPRQPQPE